MRLGGFSQFALRRYHGKCLGVICGRSSIRVSVCAPPSPPGYLPRWCGGRPRSASLLVVEARLPARRVVAALALAAFAVALAPHLDHHPAVGGAAAHLRVDAGPVPVPGD